MSRTNSDLELILASTSPYRKELLSRLKIPFRTCAPGVSEEAPVGESPVMTASRLAMEKAQAVAARFPSAVVIGSDQVAVCEGRALPKPGSRTAAREQLEWMSGRTATFHTAVAVFRTNLDTGNSAVVDTDVRYRVLSADDIEHYLDDEPAFDCAGSAKIEGLGITLVQAVRSDDPSALVGLPLIALADMLRAAGFRLP